MAGAAPEPVLALARLCGPHATDAQRLQAAVSSAPSRPLNGLRVLSPVLAPRKFLGVGGNFRSHIKEAARLGAKAPPHPVWFNKQVTCLSGPHDPILLPRDSDQLDYEGELGLVIGRRCRRVGRDERALGRGRLLDGPLTVRGSSPGLQTAHFSLQNIPFVLADFTGTS